MHLLFFPNDFFRLAFTYSSILQRDYSIFYKSKASKVAFLVTSLMAYICFAYYTADLTSLMATKPTPKTVTSFKEALELEHRFVMWGGSKAENHLKNAPEGSGRHTAYTKVVTKDQKALVSSDKEGLEQVLADHKTIFFTNVMPFLSDDRLIVVREMTDRLSSYNSFALPKGSEFKKLFDYHLLKGMQSGLIGNIIDTYLRDGKPEPGRPWQVEDAIALGFDNLLFPGLIVMAGAMMGLGLAFLEFVTKKSQPFIS